MAGGADCILIPEVPTDFDVLYKHMKERYFSRILASDVLAGAYMIVVAEGLKNADGTEIYDESAGIDSFGHKKLAGAGKFVCQELSKRMKADPEIKGLMKETRMFVEKMNEIPEVRSVVPGHLVRCGHSSAYDVNFGKEAGAAAVLLLQQGTVGVTIVGIDGDKVRYMESKKAIVQRHVDVNQVALYEQMGTCFGRPTTGYTPTFEKVEGRITRHL